MSSWREMGRSNSILRTSRISFIPAKNTRTPPGKPVDERVERMRPRAQQSRANSQDVPAIVDPKPHHPTEKRRSGFVGADFRANAADRRQPM